MKDTQMQNAVPDCCGGVETTHGLCHECNAKLYPASKISSLLLVPQASAYTAA
jgi:hypothetical protein